MNLDAESNAERLKQLLIDSSPLIEEFTRELCPHCMDVCCKQKHGIFQAKDIAYLTAIGVPVPLNDAARPLDGPCEFMGQNGCVRPRWLRPFKCTWYICGPLCEAMGNCSWKRSKLLTDRVNEMIELYRGLP